MKAKDLRNKSVDELNQELLSLLKAQFGLRMRIDPTTGEKPASCARFVVTSLAYVPFD